MFADGGEVAWDYGIWWYTSDLGIGWIHIGNADILWCDGQISSMGWAQYQAIAYTAFKLTVDN